MGHTLKEHEIMWAEMAPDVYSGDNCDEIEPDWRACAEGDMDGPDSMGDLLSFNARGFPAGTRIVISVPECPECHTQADLCDCGFDWEEWTYNQYS